MSLDHVDTLISFALVMLLLAMLITTVVEGVNAAFMRRGWNLQWGVAQVLERLGVEKVDATKLASLVLKHPAVSSTGIARTSAIRVDELARLVVELAQRNVVALKPEVEAKFRAAIAGLEDKAQNKLGAHRARELEALILAAATQAQAAFEQRGLNVSIEELHQKLATEVKAKFESAARVAAEAALELGAWFNMVMDRTTERFVAHTRWVTVIASAFLCFAFQIDSARILKRLSTDDELRTALVASSGAVLGEAEKAQLELDSAKDLATRALLDLRGDLERSADESDQRLAAEFAGEIPPLRTPLNARDWLAGRVSDEAARDEIAARLEPVLEKAIDAQLKRTREIGQSIVAGLEKTQLDLLDLDKLSLKGFLDVRGAFDWRHFWGILASIALLSLGAPFWFNMLRNMSNLRPIVARKVEKSEQEAAG